MSAFRVIEHLDVIENITSGFVPRSLNLSSDSLPLQKLEKALGYGVVMALSSSAHAANHVVSLQEALPI